MNILFIGNTRAPWCTEVHLGRSLTELGHEVEHAQEDELRDNAKMRRLRSSVGAYDAVFYMRTWGAHGLDRVWKHARKLDVPTITISLDVYWGVKREHMIVNDPMFGTQWVFTADGNDRPWSDVGVNHHWMPPGVVRDGCADRMPGTPRDHWADRYDVAFVGSGADSYHPEWPVRQQLIALLRDRYGDRFCHAPHDLWEANTLDRRLALREQDLNDFYASVPIIVGDSLGAHDLQRYWSDRFCETWGRGGFLIHPWIAPLADDAGLITFPNYQGIERIPHLIDSSVYSSPTVQTLERDLIGGRVREECNYTVRMQHVLDVVFGA